MPHQYDNVYLLITIFGAFIHFMSEKQKVRVNMY